MTDLDASRKRISALFDEIIATTVSLRAAGTDPGRGDSAQAKAIIKRIIDRWWSSEERNG